MQQEILSKLWDILSTGAIGAFGGASFYLYKVSRGQDFKFSLFVINMLLAFFIGYVVGKFLSPSDYRDGIIAISGFSSFPILDFLEKRWLYIVVQATGLGNTGTQETNKADKWQK